jgi:tetratricopeptide (TPR) repeat protein
VATLDAGQLEELAREALANGNEEAALVQLAPAAERFGSARLWQFTGLLQRSLDRHADALKSFAEASRLAPDDPSIAQGFARVALEAGVDAVALSERAAQLSPTGTCLIGLIAAELAAGRGAEAEAQLDAVLARSPSWIDGHAQLAQLRSMLGQPERAYESLERALRTQPGETTLWTSLFNLAVSKGDFAALHQQVARASAANLPQPLLTPFEAVATAELGDTERADRLFAMLNRDQRHSIAQWEVRHLLRAGRTDEAIGIIENELSGARAAQFWPYASIAWRLAGDSRSQWLEGDSRLIGIFDLADRLPPLDRLAAVLRSLHVAPGEFLDQSVRGGTQTDGPLLSRVDPDIQALRAAIVSAVEDYRAHLPPADPKHPLLREKRDRPIRFSGSWSVRLRGAGYHANHVHPMGWVSSALYVALPEFSPDAPENAGWLKLGEPPSELGLNLDPSRLVEPKPGRLVLFPSWMWHGTVPFPEGERLTVAFDVQAPR